MRGVEARRARGVRGQGARRSSSGAKRAVAGGDRVDAGILGLQRARILRAAVVSLSEEGYGAVSVAAICARAGVSRRTYYEVFGNRDECLAAILTDTEAHLLRAIGEERVDRGWRERVRGGLWAILCLFDREPALARVCLVECQRAGGPVSAERERIVSRLVDVIDEGALRGVRPATAGPLTAEALVGAVIAVLAARLDGSRVGDPGRGSLHGLLGELMSMIVLPYLGPSAARRELARPLPEATVIDGFEFAGDGDLPDPLAGLPFRLTYRTARVLHAVAVLGEMGPSNRQIAEHAEIADAGQVSKLLARLEQHGLLANATVAAQSRGDANNWTLTRAGVRLVRSIGAGASQAEWGSRGR